MQIKCIGYKFVLINFLISLRRMLLIRWNVIATMIIIFCVVTIIKDCKNLKKEHCIQNQILTGILNLLIYRMYITSLVFSSYSQLGKKGLRLLISNYDLLNLFDITTQDITKTILILLGNDLYWLRVTKCILKFFKRWFGCLEEYLLLYPIQVLYVNRFCNNVLSQTA